MHALNKDTLKEIINTKKRFISILLIVLLGVGFFAGIKVTSPDMQKIVDSYFDDTDTMDIEVISTLGLTDDDIQEIKNIEGVENVVGAYSKDVLINANDKEFVVKVHNLSYDMNRVLLQEGRMPESDDECVVETSFLKGTSKNIGDTILLEESQDDTTQMLKNTEVKIVGTVASPLYISRERGSTKLASGKINYYIYVPETAFSSDIYTEIYLTVKDAKKQDAFSDEYENNVEEIKNKIEAISDSRKEARYQSLKDEVNKKQEEEMQIEKANQKIQEAKDQINDIKRPEWYILDRNQNTGFASYSQDAERIEKLSKVFPVVFFVIAALISLTSMTRMVEEQRTQIGTLKALGYTKTQIASKYIIYAILATAIGGIIGMAIGFKIIPEIIIRMYRMMYTIPNIITEFNVKIGAMGLGVAMICTVGATIFSCYKELTLSPAALMRPRSPKAGKRVLLEKITWLWKKFNFTQKVTLRNLFRYKKRVLMTIIGILGCTALMVAGFGLRESVSNMIPLQYGEVFKYDINITFKNETSREDIKNGIKQIAELEEIQEGMSFNMQEVEILNIDNTQDIQMIIPENTENFKEYINLENRKTKQKYELNNEGVIITEKLAKLLDIQEGDNITIKNTDEKQGKVKVVGITRNYLMHYLYMSPELYKQVFGEEVKYNTMLAKENTEAIKSEENLQNIENKKEQEGAKAQAQETVEDRLGKQILENTNISTISFTSKSKSMFDDVMQNMTFVVWILIVAAALLAFVVLYNLANVNISERIRELATIKVLGFYDKEVYDYVCRETTILTAIGILFGLVGGYFLNMFIIKTCELDTLMFDSSISMWTYVYATGLTVLFTATVNVATYFALKKIDMIESLKSVE